MVSDSSDAILVQDLEGRILSWNPGATRFYGWSEAEALTMNIRDLIPPAQRNDALDLIHRLSHAEVLQPYDAERVSKDGRIIRVTLTATALVNDSREIYAVATTERARE